MRDLPWREVGLGVEVAPPINVRVPMFKSSCFSVRRGSYYNLLVVSQCLVSCLVQGHISLRIGPSLFEGKPFLFLLPPTHSVPSSLPSPLPHLPFFLSPSYLSPATSVSLTSLCSMILSLLLAFFFFTCLVF